MANQTNGGISWTDETWTPIRGCTPVSAGCENCNAATMASRFNKPGQWGHGLAEGGKWTGKVVFDEEALRKPLSWRRPRRVFVSIGDVFHPDVPDEWLDRIWAMMALCPQHRFMVPTKWVERMREYLSNSATEYRIIEAESTIRAEFPKARIAPRSLPIPNVALGVSVENQETADERIPHLLATPAAKRFVSCEPLLGRVSLLEIPLPAPYDDWRFNALVAGDVSYRRVETEQGPLWESRDGPWMSGLDIVIVGGETGPNARPMHPNWARSLRDQCTAAGVPFHFKSWGEYGMADEPMPTGRPCFPQFNTFQHWVNRASTWVNGGICLDTKGSVLKCGADFMRARDEGAFPVTIMHRVGRAKSGRLLDGREHLEMFR